MSASEWITAALALAAIVVSIQANWKSRKAEENSLKYGDAAFAITEVWTEAGYVGFTIRNVGDSVARNVDLALFNEATKESVNINRASFVQEHQVVARDDQLKSVTPLGHERFDALYASGFTAVRVEWTTAADIRRAEPLRFAWHVETL